MKSWNLAMLCSGVIFAGCSTLDDLTTGNWTLWSCEEDMVKLGISEREATQMCLERRREGQRIWANANGVAEDTSWSRSQLSNLSVAAGSGMTPQSTATVGARTNPTDGTAGGAGRAAGTGVADARGGGNWQYYRNYTNCLSRESSTTPGKYWVRNSCAQALDYWYGHLKYVGGMGAHGFANANTLERSNFLDAMHFPLRAACLRHDYYDDERNMCAKYTGPSTGGVSR